MTIDLGQITNLQKRVGVKIDTKDANGNTVPNFGLPNIQIQPPGSVSIENLVATEDLPAGSTFTLDIVSQTDASTVMGGPLAVTLAVRGQQGDFKPQFTDTFTLSIVIDPSLPGLPTHWDLASAGASVAK